MSAENKNYSVDADVPMIPENVSFIHVLYAPSFPTSLEQKFPSMIARNVMEHIRLVEEMHSDKFATLYNAMANGERACLKWHFYSNINYAQHNQTFAYPQFGLFRDYAGKLHILHAIGKVKVNNPGYKSFWCRKWVGHVGMDFSGNFFNLQPVLLPPNFFETTKFYQLPEEYYETLNPSMMGNLKQLRKDDISVTEATTPRMLFLTPSMARDLFALSPLNVGKVFHYFKKKEKENKLEPYTQYIKPFVVGLIHKNTANVNVSHSFFDDGFKDWRKKLLYSYYGNPTNLDLDNITKIDDTVYHYNS